MVVVSGVVVVVVSTIWNALIKCWTSIYTGLPNRIIVDQGSNFGESSIRLAALDGIKVERTGIEAHNGLSICERYHEPIRTTVRKILLNFPKAEFELTLALAVKALNDKAGPDGLVPSALLFGEFPRLELPDDCSTRPTTDERGKLALIIRNEVRQHIDKMRISRALRHNVPKDTDTTFDPGDQVLVWREKHTATGMIITLLSTSSCSHKKKSSSSSSTLLIIQFLDYT